MIPEVSIIIVSWNGEKILHECLKSIFSQECSFRFEVILVDNGSKDNTVKMTKSNFPHVRIKLNKNNLGFPIANNLGIKIAKGKFILLLNQDIELKKGVLEKLFNFLNNNLEDKIRAVAPKLKYPNGKIQKSLRPFPTPLNILKDVFSFGRWHENYYDYRKSQTVDQPMASCLMFDSRVLKKVGGFDTNPYFFLYFNDVDLSFRIFLLGFKHYYLSDCEAIHHHGQSTKKWPEVSRQRVWSKGLYYFLAKHYAKKSILLRLIFKIEVFLVFLVKMFFGILKRLFS